MLTLDEMMAFPEGREIKRVIAVKMIIQGFEVKDICSLLGVSDSYVSKWKIIYENEGARALRLNYKGRAGFLTELERDEIFCYLKDKPHYTVEELSSLIECRYGVVYHSKQPYYDILKEAGLSWHKSQAVNPKRDEAQVLLKREEIKGKIEERQEEIKNGQTIVFAEDESHLLAGDTTGHGWWRRNETAEVPIKNIKERQTYYGVLDLYNKDFLAMPFDKGNGANTVLFIQHLQSIHPDKKLVIIWDGASYHRGEEVRSYLSKVNDGLDEKDWKVTCLLFAPHAPDQNPVEDVWLRGKDYLRKHFYENKTFTQVKNSFINFLNKKIFNFKKIEWYMNIPQPE